VISTFFAPDFDRKAFYRGLVSAVNVLCSQVENAGYRDPVPAEVIRRALSDLLSVPAEDEDFLSGGITFCNLRDARSIPCKVLCLLGMDENAFPTAARPDSFDLIRDRMDKTYRSPRFQDRYFFLESLRGVQDYLLIYYRGQDDVMDREFSPATVITELNAYVSRIFPRLNEKEHKVTVTHSLLPYSHDYFAGTEAAYTLRQKWSFNHYACAVDTTLREASRKAAAREERVPRYPRLCFREAGLLPEEPTDTVVTVKLSELEDFFCNAGFVFLRNAFSFPQPTDFGGDRCQDEPIDPDDLEKWFIKDFLSRWLIKEIPEEKVRGQDMGLDEIAGIDEVLARCHEHFCRLNRLAPGASGLVKLKALAAHSWIKHKKARDAWRELCESREIRQLQLEFDDVVQLPDRELCTDYDPAWPHYPKVVLQYSTKKPKKTAQVMLTLGSKSSSKYESRIVLRHLFFQAYGDETPSYLAVPDGLAKECGVLSRADARARLKKILSFYLYGKRHPLPIMERCMWGDDLDTCFRTQGKRPDSCYGDFQLPYVRLLWGDEKLDEGLKEKILALQALRDLPGAGDPTAAPTEER